VQGADPKLVIAGGGVAGLALALAAGRQGIDVEVVERDPAPTADSPEAAFTATRRGAPQVHQSHGFLARLTLVLRQRFPDVLDALMEAGARPLPIVQDPSVLSDGEHDLPILALRRTTLEWVLRRAVVAEGAVRFRNGSAVTGVVAEPARADRVPHVTGLRLDSGEVLAADIVAACTGRRGDVPRWLGAAGVEIPEEEHDTRFVYLTRWYRQLDPDAAAEMPPRLGADLGYLKYLAVPCDGNTFSITLAVRAKDAELRGTLADPTRFEQTCRLLPGPAELFEQGPLEALGPVLPMGGLVNRLRRFTDAGGAPLVTGFHAVGDAHTCTNPLYGRGCALAFVQATLLADAIAAHPGDPAARAVAYETGSAREVEPWFHASVQMDAYRPPRPNGGGGDSDTDGGDGGDGGGAAAPDAPREKTLTEVFAQILAEGETDPVIGRAIARLFNLLMLPDELMTDVEFLSRVAPIVARPMPELPTAAPGPTRDEVLAGT
jgi:2-polyprenyl-6-methoxyphenol hydroxylase-like FAD-dependent oxidoreductase